MSDINKTELLKEKSIEAFLLSLEIINKPTIKYRLEGCVFFLCNAWELLLKAKLINDGIDVFYPNKTERTLSLSDCIKEIFTNEKDPVRQNLNVIISLRNTSTHFIIPEYEAVYFPFLAFCVKSYVDKLYSFFSIDIKDYIKTDFLSMFVSRIQPPESEILSKYGEDILAIYKKKNQEMQNYYSCDEGSSIAYRVEVNFVRINNKSKADYSFYISKDESDPHIKYIDRPVDANISHTMTHNQVANEIDAIIKKQGIRFTPIREPIKTEKNQDPHVFTTACLDVLIKKFDLKNNPDYVVKINNGKSIVYKYSKRLVTLIITKISEDKDIVVKLKKQS
ncbi:MAG: DUF3644 domain-containing protein [Candidatus Ornithospirochaeta sp.]